MKETSLQKIENISQDDLAADNFEVIKVYADSDHYIRKLIKHKPSGELYFYEFKEEIDMVNGNDPQYRTYVPVKNEQEAEKLSKLDIMEILSVFPRLIDDWHADNTHVTKWVR